MSIKWPTLGDSVRLGVTVTHVWTLDVIISYTQDSTQSTDTDGHLPTDRPPGVVEALRRGRATLTQTFRWITHLAGEQCKSAIRSTKNGDLWIPSHQIDLTLGWGLNYEGDGASGGRWSGRVKKRQRSAPALTDGRTAKNVLCAD